MVMVVGDWQLPFGTTEDRNEALLARFGLGLHSWGSPSGAAEDRNITPDVLEEALEDWRSPSGAAEDRNLWLYSRVVPSVVHGFGRRPDPRSGDVHEF
jgi:hypothetical protein